MKIHIVQKGDTLWKIAKKYGVNFEELKKLNSQLSNPDMIMPGMKVKVPTSGGTIKKESPMGPSNPGKAINLGVKKEVPLAEHPFAKEKPVPMPIVEAPKKEVPIAKEKPIIKEAPKTPYIPKMPLQVVPEIDINNYYMTNMQHMKVELPPKPTNILPEVKEVPKKEVPKKEIPMKEVPMKEVPIQAPPVVEAPVQEYCVPVSPVMPGPGFCPPYGGYPMMPYPQVPGVVMPGAVMPGPPMAAPAVAGASYLPHHFHDESSSFMPQMPMSPGYNPGVMMGTPAPAMQQPAYVDPAAYGQMPGGYPMGSYDQMPGIYQAGVPAAGYPSGYPTEYPAVLPAVQNPAEFAQQPVIPGTMYSAPGMVNPYTGTPGYGQMPHGYPDMMAPAPQVMGVTAPGMAAPYMPGYPTQGLPVGTGAMGDCGCGPVPAGMPAGISNAIPNIVPNTVPNVMPTNVPAAFVPPTPPIYSAPYTGPVNVAQPPFMNPYGMGPVGMSPYGMPGYKDESS